MNVDRRFNNYDDGGRGLFPGKPKVKGSGSQAASNLRARWRRGRAVLGGGIAGFFSEIRNKLRNPSFSM